MADTKIVSGTGPSRCAPKKHKHRVTPDVAIGLAYVYRPGATGADAPGGNVFTTWPPLMAALDATKHLGTRVLIFDSTIVTPGFAQIPAGVWNMTDVKWEGTARSGGGEVTEVELMDGAQIVLDPGVNHALQIEGYGFQIYYNGTGPTPPFDGVNILCGGNFVRFGNTSALAKPMFRVQGFNIILFSGECVNGGLIVYPEATLARPVIDLNGGEFFVFGGAGRLANGFATDLSGGPGGSVFAVLYDGFLGADDGDFVVGDFWVDQWNCPELEAAGGAVFFDYPYNCVRNRINPFLTGLPIVLPVYPAVYNEFAPIDTTGGAVTVNLPSAQRSYGERVTVKDATPGVFGAALANNITIASTYGDAIDGPLAITTIGGSMTFVCWNAGVIGTGVWSLVARI